jgi:hypothetical protein
LKSSHSRRDISTAGCRFFLMASMPTATTTMMLAPTTAGTVDEEVEATGVIEDIGAALVALTDFAAFCFFPGLDEDFAGLDEEVVGVSVGEDVVGVSVGDDVVGVSVGDDVVGVSVGEDVVGVSVGEDVVGVSVGDAVGDVVGEVVGEHV